MKSVTGGELAKLTDLEALPDGRIAVALASQRTQNRSSVVIVAPTASSRGGVEHLYLPVGADVYALASDESYLYAVGSGWFAMRFPLDSIQRR